MDYDYANDEAFASQEYDKKDGAFSYKPRDEQAIRTYKNVNYKQRDYEATNIVFAQSKEHPEPVEIWKLCKPQEIYILNCKKIERVEAVTYFGYL